MENTQSAIEWAEDTIANLNSAVINQEITTQEYHEQRVRLWEQAKEMEKQQIIDAHVYGDENHTFNSFMREEYANDYYNETYKQQDNGKFNKRKTL